MKTMTPALTKDAPITSIALGAAVLGYRGHIRGINTATVRTSTSAYELEQQLIEIGFVEGAFVEILHQGTFFKDPIAVRLGSTTIALRRREAMAVLVE